MIDEKYLDELNAKVLAKIEALEGKDYAKEVRCYKTDMNYIQFKELQNITKKFENSIQEIKRMNLDIMSCSIINLNLLTHDNWQEETNKSGFFKLVFKDQSYYYILALNPIGENRKLSFIYSTPHTMDRFSKLIQQSKNSKEKPRVGAFEFTFEMNMSSLYNVYSELDFSNLPNIEATHPAYDEIEKDIKFFFKQDIEYFNKFNKPKIKKTLLLGGAGTGKTTILNSLIKKFHKDCHVCVVNSVADLFQEFFLLEGQSIPAIIIFDDIDDDRAKDGNTLFEIPGWLSKELMKNEIYCIFSLNSETSHNPYNFINRPDSINKVIKVGVLEGEYALKCAKQHFKGVYKVSDEDIEIFEGLTGYQVSELADICRNKAPFLDEPINSKTILEAKKEYLQYLEQNEKIMKETRSISLHKCFGVEPDDENAPF